MVGYGNTGVVSATSFTGVGGTDGVKRWGSQKINTDYSYTQTVGSWTSYLLRMDFNLNNTTYESGGNTYDSGGGLFFNDSGTWKVAGINAYRFGDKTGNLGISVRRYVPWIKSVIVDYDTDMDGLPDWWEDMHGASETAMDANGYSDSDSFTNYEEWLADTDPNDGNSFLALNEYTHTVQVAFSSSTNRDYQVQYQTNLTNEPWMTEIDWFSVAGTQTVKTVSTGTSNRFYRIRAKLQ